MEVKLFRTESGPIFYYYLGIETVNSMQCHVWEVVVQTYDETLLCGRSCYVIGSPINIDACEAASDAAVLILEHQRMSEFLGEE